LIDRELPVMAAVALAVGLGIAVLINSFAGTSGPAGEELRRAADRPPSNVAAMRLRPPVDRPRPVKRRHRRPAGTAHSAPVKSLPAGRTPARSGTAPQQPPALTPNPRPAPEPAPRPGPKTAPSGGGTGEPFDDSG
jgi:hypothetical protein